MDDLQTGVFQPKLHDEDVFYAGVLQSIEKEPEGKFGPQFRWTFLLDDDKGKGEGKDGDDRTIFHWTATTFGTDPRNKLYQALKGLTGSAPSTAEPPHLGQFIGKRVRLMFVHEDKGGVKKEKIDKLRLAS